MRCSWWTTSRVREALAATHSSSAAPMRCSMAAQRGRACCSCVTCAACMLLHALSTDEGPPPPMLLSDAPVCTYHATGKLKFASSLGLLSVSKAHSGRAKQHPLSLTHWPCELYRIPGQG
eukprot:1142273-Pelagomonas_calceolata.AAC.3